VRVEFLLKKTDSGYPKDTGILGSPWQPLGIPFAITPIGQPHQSSPSPIPGDRAHGKRRGVSPGAAARHSQYARVHTEFVQFFFFFHLSGISQGRSHLPVDMLEHRDAYGQAQVCSNGHQGSSVDRPCQPSFHWIKFWVVRPGIRFLRVFDYVSVS